MFETIVALATPPLKSALAIIRLSGDDCFEVLSKCFSKDLKECNKRNIYIGSILDDGNKIDDVVVNVYKGPKSFTGEDSVEIIAHGSPLICKQIITKLIACGARMATNGEFSSRAFLHNKIDLVQAEAINDVINATTIENKNLSLLSLKGDTSNLVNEIKTKIADLISLIEVNIDYPEYEDIEVANKETIITSVDKTNILLNQMIDDSEKAKIVKDGIKVAIVGKPNVGKSSLLNALVGENKAIVTDIAGTTRDIVEGDINLKGLPVHLLDTAGIRESDNKVEGIGISKSIESIETADVVIVVLDGSSKLDEEDDKILNITKNCTRIVVYNKADIAKKLNDEEINISALNGDVDPLINEIYSIVGIGEKVFKQPALNNARQIGLLKNAKTELLKAKEDAINDLTIDLISVSLLNAYSSILEILGENNQLDLAKEIFARFCVGK